MWVGGFSDDEGDGVVEVAGGDGFDEGGFEGAEAEEGGEECAEVLLLDLGDLLGGEAVEEFLSAE